MALLKIRIKNWEKFNPRADRANYSWFRFQNAYFSDQQIFMLSDSQIATHVFCVCELSKKNVQEVELQSEYCAAMRRKKEAEILRDLQELEFRGLIELWINGVSAAESRRDDGVKPSFSLATNERTIRNDTNETILPDSLREPRRQFDFESLYKKYPRKEGKAKGIAVCRIQVKGPEDFDALSMSIDRYTEHIKRNATEAKYVKHFSTFMGSWRDWLDPENGTSASSNVGPTGDINWKNVFGEKKDAG